MRIAIVLGLVIAIGLVGAGRSAAPRGFTSEFHLGDCELVADGANAYFSLEPGRFSRFEGFDKKEFVELEITVLRETKEIAFEAGGRRVRATARVIEEREWADGELVEVSRNYFSRCGGTQDIFYLGEDVDIYEGGVIVSHDGSWLAGEGGARPGLIMPGTFLLGSRYFQEVAPDVALDRAEHVEGGLMVRTPAGVFTGCVVIEETTTLEPGHRSVKVYAPGAGLIMDGAVQLVERR